MAGAIGAQLRELLLANDLTPAEAGEIMGLSRSAVLDRIYGRTQMGLAEAEALTAALRTPLHALTGTRHGQAEDAAPLQELLQ